MPTLDLEWLRRNVTLVQQSSVFFHDTFFQNVAFGASDPDNVSPQAVRDACSMALLQSTIAGLPDGLLTKVGSGDCNLSGGQKQRLALARAKLRDPPVLILDEITSGLDPVSRSLIMEAIRIWRKGKTTIIITHEVGQIQEDDYVYVLADGSIVQRGFGHELSKDESGLFASLVASADETCSLADSDISNSESESDCGIPWQEPTEERRFSGFLPRFSTGSRLSWGLFQGTEWRVEPVNARETFIGPRQAPKQGHPPSGMHIVTKAGLEVQSRRALHARQTREKILTQQHQASLDSLELFFLERLAERKDKTKSPKGPEPLSMLVVLKTVWPTLDFLGKGEFILGLLLCLVLASSTPIFAFLFANLLSAFWLPEARGAASVMWSVFLTVTAVAAAASTFFSYFFMEMVAQKWVNRLRAEAIQRILSQPKPWFDSASHSASNIAQCLDRNAEEMRKLVGTFLPILLSVSAMILGAIIWALVIRWDLTLVTLVGVPLALGTARANAMISDKWETNCDEAAASTGAIFSEAYSNVKVVRALTLERYFSDKHALSARSTFRLGLKRAAWVGTFFGLYNCISYFLTSLVFFYSAKILCEGLTTVTDVIRVNNLLLFTLGTAVVLLAHVPQIAAAKTTAKRMLYYANLSHVAGHETQGGMRLSTPFPVRMTNLRFAYPSAPDKLILRNINLRIDAGTFTALVGASGCGKSTITALLLRLYEPSQGDDESNTATTRPPAPVRTPPSYSRPLTFIPSPIPESPVSQKKTIPSPSSALTFASHPASSLSTRSLRAQLGYVPQTPFLFPASVFANLTYGLPENSPLRDEANVHLAARQAGIHDFIVSLPRGYDTPLGEGGQQVSGGQAQRLCIARALVRRPRLLILDEPTSALDAQSAEAIRRVVRDLVAAQRRRSGGGSQGGMIPTEEEDVDMAVVVVTHSKEMMRVADRVVMVEDGVIVESGGYKELVRKGGKFAGLVGGGMWAPGTADGKGKGRRMVGEEKMEAEVKRSREETLYKLEGF
jgi:ATP-binding cassette subfamily B (MDR/TAP) protein 1